jgi:multidrug transporter EmrE-like cation transporter
MAWTYQLIAGLLEIGLAIGLKYRDGWTRRWSSVLTLATPWRPASTAGPSQYG